MIMEGCHMGMSSHVGVMRLLWDFMAALVQALIHLIFTAGKIATVALGIIHQRGYATYAVQEPSV
jgi:hypothetical protein